MAKYKSTDAAAGQGLFLTVNLPEQLLPGSFEYMLNQIIDGKIDTGIFDKNYKNDVTGASAVPPSVLLKLIIYGYRKGHKSSRKLEELNNTNIIAKALTGDMPIHFTTIADFISGNSEEFEKIFMQVLAYCNELELIGGEDYAIDGLRLPSNASIEMSGTEAELQKNLAMYRRMAEKHIAKHHQADTAVEADEETKRRYEDRQHRLNLKIEKLSAFLETMEKREGQRGQEIKSNVTDNESAVIHSSSGYLQGYIGIAVTDKKSQIIVNAEAVGSANECEHMPGILTKTLENIEEAGVKSPEGTQPVFMGDANYFSEDNLQACQEAGVEAIIPDSQHRRCLGNDSERRYEAKDFEYHEQEDYYECPHGKKLEYKRHSVLGGQEGRTYQASVKDCRHCPLSDRCIRSKKEKSAWDRGRQIYITKSNNAGSLCAAMREKLSTEEYQDRYAYRIQIAEPVFANIAYCKGLNRFMLRGKRKVNGQWKLYCIVHNLGKCLDGYNAGKWSA